LATAIDAHEVYESADGGKTWKKGPESTFSIRSAMGYQDQILAVSWHNGLLMQRLNSAAALPATADVAASTVRDQK
jgi:hypothetical protein